MALSPADILSIPGAYHHLRQCFTGGMPFGEWCGLYGLTDPKSRIADLGCGPADILRYVRPGQGPAFYLGIDLSSIYLTAAQRRARKAGISAQFVPMDLDRIPADAGIRDELVELLERHEINRVLLLGVLHHLDDTTVDLTLGLIHRARTVAELITSDVVCLPGPGLGASMNNFLCRHDRGDHVRDEPGYDDLVNRSVWEHHRKFWTHPRFSYIRYLHYSLTRRVTP